MAPASHLVCIVATTPSMGIGHCGSLPWPALRGEMAYFARVTRRAPPDFMNAVLMGRKTWESIPEKFRPLKGRVNIVISRRADFASKLESSKENKKTEKDLRLDSPVHAYTIEEAMTKLRKWHDPSAAYTPKLHRIFVIGGAEIYNTVLDMPEMTRILRTKVMSDFQCDTFFPLNLDLHKEWKQSTKADLDEWTGEEVPPGQRQEGYVRWEFEMWEKAT